MGPGATSPDFTQTSAAVEVFDVAEPSMKCSMPNYPVEVFGSYGGAKLDGRPLICSGVHNATLVNAACNYFNKYRWELAPFSVLSLGKLPAYADYPTNQHFSKVVALGSSRYALRHNGFVDEGRTIPRVEFVEGLCVAFLRPDTLMVLGTSVNRTRAFFQNTTGNNEFLKMSHELMFPHSRAGCGKVRVNQFSTTQTMVIAGGDGQLTTEILIDTSQGWRLGPGT